MGQSSSADPASPSTRRTRTGAWRQLAIVVTVAAVFAVVGWVVGRRAGVDPSSERQAPSAREIAPLTVAVESRPLLSQRRVAAQFQSAEHTAVSATLAVVAQPGAMQPLITWLPEPGATLDAGQVLYEVSGRPVFAVAGTTPMYRDLMMGATGRDVDQLEAMLIAVGLPLRADGTLGDDDLGAIATLYERSGYAPPPADTGVLVPGGELIVVPSLPVTVTAIGAQLGGPAGGEVLSVGSAELVVTCSLAPADAAQVMLGDTATLIATDATPVTLTVVSMTPSAAGAGGIDLRLEPSGDVLGARAGAGALVEFSFGGSPDPVLVVPMSAIATRADGTSVVRVVEGAGATDVAVTLGVMADGYVAIVPAGPLTAGDRVVIGVART